MSHRLRNVRQEHAFYVRNGSVLHNLYHLEKSLRHMHDHDFRHHANESKNDFSSWSIGVIKDARLAHQLQNLHSKKDMARAVKLRIRELEQKKTVDSRVMRHVRREAYKKSALKKRTRRL
jgi:hypothetical protein